MKKTILISLIAAPFIIAGCGSSSSTTAKSAKITGTVPGTFIEAYCDDGTYASVESVQNGTNQHPYSITVPTNTNCMLVMTTNQNSATERVITPITINGKNSINLNEDTDIGYADIPANYSESTDRDGDHVQDSPVNVSPETLNGTSNDTITNSFDQNHDGKVDTLEDSNGNHTPDGWEDRDGNGQEDIFDDENHNGKPDSVERNEGSENNNANEGNEGSENHNANETEAGDRR